MKKEALQILGLIIIILSLLEHDLYYLIMGGFITLFGILWE